MWIGLQVLLESKNCRDAKYVSILRLILRSFELLAPLATKIVIMIKLANLVAAIQVHN